MMSPLFPRSSRLSSFLPGSAVLFAIFAALPLCAHNTAHQYTFQTNGVLRLGREAESGGAIIWLSEEGGPNVVNNGDTGRQIQMNVRDAVGDYNPTQAGDGPNASGSLVYFTHRDYTFSKCVPLLFYNEPPYSGPPRPATGHWFYMWSEFLPHSGGRGFRVRTYYENTDPRPGQSYSHAVAPADILNYAPFAKVLTYSGTAPWTGGALTAVTDRTGDFVSTRYRMTELWHGLYDTNDWGLGHLENFGWADLLFFLDANQTGDHQWACKSTAAWERFNLRVDPGENAQVREGSGIYYLGDVNAARAFFATYRPVKTGDCSDDFRDPHLFNWWRNSNPIQVINGAVKMGPDTSWVNDLSLINKFWQDGTFSVDVKHESGSSWYGLAIRKVGQGHFWESHTGYYLIYLTATGNLTLYSPAAGTIASANVPGYVATNWNRLSVSVTNFNFTIRVNGTTRLTATDTRQSHPAGYVSLVSDQNVTWFDNFTVQASGGDTNPPAPVTNLAVLPGASSNQLSLAWANPPDADWRWTRLVRKAGTPPTHWRDGYPVYEGKLSAYVDPDCQPGTNYHYAAYTVDHAGNYSVPVTVDATAGVGPAPTLRAVPSAGAVELLWPEWASAFSLQSRSSLEPPAIWLPVTNRVALTNGQHRVLVPVPDPQRFFQLQWP
jgi:hypothetical protein